MNSFFLEALKTIKTSGTIRPSSSFLINDCLKSINFSNAKTVIEFGTGNGCITSEIERRLPKDGILYSFELNSSFFSHSMSKFKGSPKVKLINSNAINFDRILFKLNITEVDLIISSLPLTLLNDGDINKLLFKVCRCLKKDKYFVQYQYSLGKLKLLKKVFDKVDIDLTIRNIPPAFIYKCQNLSS